MNASIAGDSAASGLTVGGRRVNTGGRRGRGPSRARMPSWQRDPRLERNHASRAAMAAAAAPPAVPPPAATAAAPAAVLPAAVAAAVQSQRHPRLERNYGSRGECLMSSIKRKISCILFPFSGGESGNLDTSTGIAPPPRKVDGDCPNKRQRRDGNLPPGDYYASSSAAAHDRPSSGGGTTPTVAINTEIVNMGVDSESIAEFAYDVITRTEGNLLVVATEEEVEKLCGFLIAKYAVADIAIPARMSPSATVDAAWHRLMLFPGAYDAACRRAYELAAGIVGEGDDDFAYDQFPGVVDHSPNAANDPPSAKEQRRQAAVWEMDRLGLPSPTARRPAQPRVNICTPPTAPGNRRARLTNSDGIGRNAAEEEAKEEGATGNVENARGSLNIVISDMHGEETWFKVKNCNIAVGCIMRAYAKLKGVYIHSLRFMLDGENFDPAETLAELGLEDGDKVDVGLAQGGC